MGNNIKVSASIVLFKNEYNILLNTINSFLDNCLDSVLYLIDNSPTNDLQNISTDPRVFYIHNPSNPGFGTSHNIAIYKSFEINSDFHLVLNPDIYFFKGTIDKIVHFMNSNLEIGLLMPKVLYPDGTNQYLCKKKPNIFDFFLRGFSPVFIKKIFQNRMETFQYANHNLNSVITGVPYLSGCFMFFRTSELKKVGLFDTRFFMYMEDADLSYRFFLNSKTCYYPEAVIYHYYSGLTHKNLKFKLITIKSLILYFNKWGWLKNLI